MRKSGPAGKDEKIVIAKIGDVNFLPKAVNEKGKVRSMVPPEIEVALGLKWDATDSIPKEQKETLEARAVRRMKVLSGCVPIPLLQFAVAASCPPSVQCRGIGGCERS